MQRQPELSRIEDACNGFVETTKLELERVYTELSENVQHLRKTERLTAAGHLAANLTHEIRNLLASIGGVAGILARGQAPAESFSHIQSITVYSGLTYQNQS
jgi:two-component system sensor histidine kinase HydH